MEMKKNAKLFPQYITSMNAYESTIYSHILVYLTKYHSWRGDPLPPPPHNFFGELHIWIRACQYT